MVNCAEFVPEVTITLAGTFTNGASPASVMTAPPVGAAALKVTVPVTLEPPVTEFAESVSPETVWLKAAGANCSKVSMSRQSAKIGERKCREGRAEKAGQRRPGRELNIVGLLHRNAPTQNVSDGLTCVIFVCPDNNRGTSAKNEEVGTNTGRAYSIMKWPACQELFSAQISLRKHHLGHGGGAAGNHRQPARAGIPIRHHQRDAGAPACSSSRCAPANFITVK